MQLSIKVKISDDTTYRYKYSPYDFTCELTEDVMAALDDALSMMAGGGDNAVVNIKNYGTPVGVIKVKAR